MEVSESGFARDPWSFNSSFVLCLFYFKSVSVRDSFMAIILKPENVAKLVFFIRSEKVILDVDLAQLYGVTTKALNQAMRRNKTRFPEDFAFRLTREEFDSMRSQIVTSSEEQRGLRSQIVTSKTSRGGRRYLPYAFTEQGVAMLSSVLRSPRAIDVNIAIMRTFVQLRRFMDANRDLARKIEALEKKYDEQFAVVFEAIKQLIAPPAPTRKQIGFHP
jgi:hypothetical protein